MRRTHKVNKHRAAPAATQPDPYAEAAVPPASRWGEPIDQGVGCNLQPLTGSVQELAAGAQVNADWKGFFPATMDLQEGDGLVVTDGVGPRRYIVQQVGQQGGPWDTEALLSSTAETIP